MNNRREFLLMAPALGSALLHGADDVQSFHAGTCLGGRDAEGFWKICDTCAQLGFHYIESSGGGVRLVDVYAGKPGQLKDELERRNLHLIGYAHYSQMADPAQLADMISLHLRIARTLQPAGTKYITHLLIPPPRPGVAANKLPAQMTAEDFKNFGRNANEVGKQVREETGLRIGYHPETVDVAAGLVDRILDSTDPRYFDFVADVGHLKAGGLDPMQVYKKYRSRIITTHFRDYNPSVEYERNGEHFKGRFVPLGQGVIDLPALAAFLKETKFNGQVMAEGGGFEASRDYMVQKLSFTL